MPFKQPKTKKKLLEPENETEDFKVAEKIVRDRPNKQKTLKKTRSMPDFKLGKSRPATSVLKREHTLKSIEDEEAPTKL